MIALFMAFRPEARCRLSHPKLRSHRSLVTKRKRPVDALECHSMQCKDREKHALVRVCLRGNPVQLDLRAARYASNLSKR